MNDELDIPATDEQVASVARALGHPARVRIVRLLAAQSDCRGAEIFAELPLAQSTISEHLRILRDAGLVSSRPVGAAMVYCLSHEALTDFATLVGTIACAAPSCGTDTKESR